MRKRYIIAAFSIVAAIASTPAHAVEVKSSSTIATPFAGTFGITIGGQSLEETSKLRRGRSFRGGGRGFRSRGFRGRSFKGRSFKGKRFRKHRFSGRGFHGSRFGHRGFHGKKFGHRGGFRRGRF